MDYEQLDEDLLTEVFDIRSAKGYDFAVTDMSTVTVPEITFEAVFTADNGVEYAFRAYMSNYLPGRKYGKHTRVLAFMRRKTKKFSQNFSVDPGTFKKVLVTFFRCYEVYKASKDGQRASSYAVMLQNSIAKYAPLFVRVSNRAFKTERRVKLELYGVNPEARGGGVELFYVNPMSIHPYFGGKDFDDTFTTSQLYLDLAKLPSVEDIEPVAANAVVTQQVAEPVVKSDVKPARDPLNPDGIAGLNDPMNFNAAFITAAFTAPGRDELEAVFRAHRIHRRYFQANIETATTIWDDAKTDIKVFPLASTLIDGVGFYLKRANQNAFKRVITEVLIKNVAVIHEPTDEVVKLIAADAIDTTTPLFDTVSAKVIDEFLDLGLFPVQHDVKERLERLLSVLKITGGSITPEVVLSWPVRAIGRLFAGVALNALKVEGFGIEFFKSDVFKSDIVVVDNTTVEVNDVSEVLRRIKVVTDRYGVGSVAFTEPNPRQDYSEGGIIAALKAGDKAGVDAAFKELRLGEKSDESLATVKTIVSALNSAHGLDSNAAVLTLADAESLRQPSPAPELRRLAYGIMISTLAAKDDATSSTVNIALTFARGIGGHRADIIIEPIIDSVERSYEQMIKVADTVHSEAYRFTDDSAVVAAVKEANTTHNYTNRNAKAFVEYLEASVSRGRNDAVNALVETTSGLDIDLLNRLYQASYHRAVAGYIIGFNMHLTKMYQDAAVIEKFIVDMWEANVTRSSVTRFINLKGNAAFTAGVYRAINTIRAGMVHDDLNADGNEQSIVVLALGGDADTLADSIGREAVVDAVKNNPRILHTLNVVANDIPSYVVDAVVEGVEDIANSPGFNNTARWSYDVYSDAKYAVVNALSSINAGMIDAMSPQSIAAVKRMFGMIDATQTTKRSQYQPILDKMSDLLSEADRSNVPGLAQDLLDACGDREKRLLVKSIGKNLFFNRYMKELKESNIGITIDLDKKKISNILNFNNISMAKLPNLTEKDSIDTAKKKVSKVELGLPEERVDKIELSREQLDDLTIEYDAFNRKKHNLSLLIEESFAVSIPSQVSGRAAWDARMQEEGIDSKIVTPAFHGTGSIAAAMILRLGFAVSSIADTQKTGVKVAGRMLGDGIYFSSAIDKVAQYASDGGYGRRVGEYGYIFEMNVSLGKHRRDFREGGTGTQYDERRSLVSPEWAVFNPNEQIVITKAHKIKRVPHYVVDNLKKKRNLKESENVTAIRGFRDVIREALGYEDNTDMVTFIFADGFIPVGGDKFVDFEDAAHDMLGKNVRIEGGQLGAMVTFTRAVVNADEVDIYHVDSTPSFIGDTDEVRNLYFRLLGE